MKTLVILAHPNMHESRVNNAWMNSAASLNESVTIHDIYQKYPDGKINVEEEQRLITEHDAMVLQFPLYWFSTPPLLKQWQDDVLTPGFAYGPDAKDRQLTGMPIGFAVSAGIKSDDYQEKGRYIYSVKELLAPLHSTFSYIGAKSLDPFVFYGAEYSPPQEEIDANAKEYVNYLNQLKTGALPVFS